MPSLLMLQRWGFAPALSARKGWIADRLVPRQPAPPPVDVFMPLAAAGMCKVEFEAKCYRWPTRTDNRK